MYVVSRLLSGGGGPSRVRAGLRKGIRTVRRAAMLLRSQHAQTNWLAQFTLPASVMGGDLLSLLSDPLRLLLRAEEATQVAVEPTVGQRRRMEGPEKQQAQRARLPSLNIPSEKRVSDNTGQEALPTPGRTMTEPHGTPTERQLSTTLDRQLAKYFHPVRANTSPIEPLDRGPRPTLPSVSPVISPRELISTFAPNSPDGLLKVPDWPALSGQELAQRMQAFVSGDLPKEGSRSVRTSEGNRVEVSNTFHIQVGATGNTSSLSQELSDQVAEILRSQAIQHGIDIT